MGSTITGRMVALAALLSCAAWLLMKPPATTKPAPIPPASAAPRALQFEPNQGQAALAVRWLVHGTRQRISIFDDGAAIAGRGGAADIALRFVGARRGGSFEPRDAAAAQSHHLIGNDPRQWRSGLPRYRQLRYAGLYDGVDLVWYSRDGELEFDLVVQPGADPSRIRLRIAGAQAPSLDADGQLLLDGPDGSVRIKRPVLHQHAGGQRQVQHAQWRIDTAGDAREVSLALPAYDRSRVLVIDPVIKLLHSTYLGGVHDDQVNAMVLDAQGNAYVVGQSGSEDWPVSGNAVQTTRKALGSYVRNVVVSKFDAAGTLLWSTFLGGSTNDYGRSIALDAKGQVVISGQTHSADFPTTADALQRNFAGATSGFFAVLSPDGSVLVHSTLYGGSGGADAFDILLDGSGRLWATGTAGAGLPTTAGSYKPTLAGNGNAGFVARFSAPAAGPLRLEAASYYGIDNPPADRFATGSTSNSLALAASGAVWIVGQARHHLLPTTDDRLMPNPTATDNNAQVGAAPLCSFTYVARLSAALSTLEYASYLTGYTREAVNRSSCAEYGRGIAVADNGDVLVSGATSSDTFPTTAGAVQATYPGARGFIGHVGFAARLRADGRALVWSTYLGGSAGDTFLNGLHFDRNAGGVWMYGVTVGGANYPLSADALQSVYGGGSFDGTAVQLDAATGALRYGSFHGGSGTDNVQTVAADAGGNLRLAGSTESRNFVVTPTAFQPAYTANAFDGNDWFFRIVGVGTIGNVRPTSGKAGGEVTLTAATTGIAADARAELIAPGGAVIRASAVDAAQPSATRLTFDLSGAAEGAYTLRIVNADGGVVSRAAAFTVGNGAAAPDLQAQVIGRPKIRVGVPATFQVTVSNAGSADAYVVPVWVEVPEALTFAVFGFDAARSETLTTVENGTRYFNHLIPRVPAGDSVTIPIRLTAATNLESIPIRASLQPPWFKSIADFKAEFPGFSLGRYTPDCVAHPSDASYNNCFGTYLQYALAGRRALAAPAGAAPSAAALRERERPLADNSPCPGSGNADFDRGKSDGLEDTRNGNSNRYNPPNIKSDPLGAFMYNIGYTTGVMSAISAAAGGQSAQARPLAAPRERPLTNTSCTVPPYPNPPPTFPPPTNNSSSSAGAIDPNDKYGPPGNGAPGRFIRQTGPMAYQIAFENLASAGLPAAEVVVTDQLDSNVYDLATLSLGDITWGPHRVAVPPGQSSFSTIFPIDSTISVRIAASLNATTGVLKWTLTTIDPATKLPPSDPTLGFLPPNRNGTEGQGYVNFTLRPKPGLPDGTRWSNGASIIFDVNAPIVTPVWTNTLDSTAPVSRVNSATQRSGTADIDLAWSGTDAGAGVARYTVSVAVDGGAFAAWQSDVAATSAVYPGVVGRAYAFHVTAVDGAGNAEAAKSAAEATVTVRDPAGGGGKGGGGVFGLWPAGGPLGQTLLMLGVAAALWRYRRGHGPSPSQGAATGRQYADRGRHPGQPGSA